MTANRLLLTAAQVALTRPVMEGPDIRIETNVPMSVAAKSYPDWNGIPDISFTCEGAITDRPVISTTP
jgi:hypothetical protein